MKIRRYLASNTQEAILKVKMDLGNDALILNTKKVRQKGFFKIFAKPMVEVLAAVDEDYGMKRERIAPKQEQKPYIQSKAAEYQIKNNANTDSNGKIIQLEEQMKSMESILKQIYGEMKTSKSNGNADTQQSSVLLNMQSQVNTDSILQPFYNNLVKNEVEPEIARRIVNMVKQKLEANEMNFKDISPIICEIIGRMLGKPEAINLRQDGKPTIVMFVGPTGVGKTTTLAKIAANYAINHKKSVGLITADTYRVAAVEQLKTYAEIIDIPLSVVYSIDEIYDAINMYSDKDVIFIDTAGRSHRNKAHFEELRSLVDVVKADEVFLVLSSTVSMKNCKEVLSNYSFLKDYKLIFTKVDENPASGIILNTRYLTNRSLSYIANGQSVPDDIEEANVSEITKNLLGSIT